MEWSQLNKGKGVVDKDREARKEAFFAKKKEEAEKKGKDKPKPKIVVKAVIKKKKGN